MTDRLYRDLVEAFCKQGGLTDWEAVHKSGHLRVNEVDFTLWRPPGEGGADRLNVYCDFGAPPPARRADALQKLLEMNLFLYGENNPGFSFNPETGHVLFMAQLRLSATTAQALQAVLQTMALYVQRWRADFFLEPQAAPAGGAAGSLRAGTPPANGSRLIRRTN